MPNTHAESEDKRSVGSLISCLGTRWNPGQISHSFHHPPLEKTGHEGHRPISLSWDMFKQQDITLDTMVETDMVTWMKWEFPISTHP